MILVRCDYNLNENDRSFESRRAHRARVHAPVPCSTSRDEANASSIISPPKSRLKFERSRSPRRRSKEEKLAYASGIALMMSESPGSVMDMHETR